MLSILLIQLSTHCPVSKRKMEKFKEETLKDGKLQKLNLYMEKGWPPKTQIHVDAASYKNYRDELSSHEGILLKGNRIIVPTSMRSEINRSFPSAIPVSRNAQIEQSCPFFGQV